jgi:hypothetical protein
MPKKGRMVKLHLGMPMMEYFAATQCCREIYNYMERWTSNIIKWENITYNLISFD